MRMLFLLYFGHFLADYPLQGEFLALAKNRNVPIPGVPWYQAMAAHAFIHAGMVFVITGSSLCASLELCLHFIIDFTKCEKIINFNVDQALHLLCKVLYILILMQ